jgi:hypothetical protein
MNAYFGSSRGKPKNLKYDTHTNRYGLRMLLLSPLCMTHRLALTIAAIPVNVIGIKGTDTWSYQNT